MKNTKTESSKVMFELCDFQELEKLAKAEERPVAALIRLLTLRGLREYQKEKSA